MNLRAKFVFLIGLLGLLCLILPGSLRADTVYTYTSPAYNNCRGTYCAGGPYALSFTFDVTAGTPLDNLSLFAPGSGSPGSGSGGASDITADVSSFAFTDGSGLDITQANATAYFFSIGTDAEGDMTAWSVWAADTAVTFPTPLLEYMGSNSYFTGTYVDYSMVGPPPDDATQNLGYWRPVPEPDSFVLLGTGLLGLLALAARSKRHAPPSSC